MCCDIPIWVSYPTCNKGYLWTERGWMIKWPLCFERASGLQCEAEVNFQGQSVHYSKNKLRINHLHQDSHLHPCQGVHCSVGRKGLFSPWKSTAHCKPVEVNKSQKWRLSSLPVINSYRIYRKKWVRESYQAIFWLQTQIHFNCGE